MADKSATPARDIAHKCLGGGAGAIGALLTLAVTIGGEGTRKAIADAALAIWNDPVMLSVTVLVVVAWAFAWFLTRPKRAPDGDAIRQETHGHYSPNFAGPVRDVHIHPTPAPIQPVLTPAPKPTRAELIGRALMAPRPPEPDLLLPDLLVRVYAKVTKERGPIPDRGHERAFQRLVNLEIADKVKLRGLHVWARLGDRSLQIINEYDWEHGTFDHVKGTFYVPGLYSSGCSYGDLHFNKAEVERIWPNP